jgi:hypothetical protein
MLGVMVPPRVASLAAGVAQNPNALSLVLGANIGRSQHSPSRIKPERGKVSKHPVKSSINESWAVFNVCEAGSYFANDAGHVVPHSAAFSVKTCTPPRDANVLARETPCNHVNIASEWSSVKGLHVIPNRERREGSIVLSCHKDGLGVGLPLDCADTSVPEHLPCENSSTSARE